MRREPLPEVSHIGFLMLLLIQGHGPLMAQSLRSWVMERGYKGSSPAFYQILGRMRGKGWIEVRYKGVKKSDGSEYTITSQGKKVIQGYIDFYRPFFEEKESCT